MKIYTLLLRNFLKIIFLFFLLKPSIGEAQILNIDKTDTADYSKLTSLKFNFSTGLEVDKQKITLWDATSTAELLLQKNRELFILEEVLDSPTMAQMIY